jgi:CHAT domain-containing protein
VRPSRARGRGDATVVATLWKVSDESAPVLMEDLYRGLVATNGGEKLDVLVAAKRSLRRSRPHPFHWASFVLLGDPR